MTSDQLKALQAPLKQQYQEPPNMAFITLRAEGTLSNRIACNISTGRALVEAGLHPATGGTGELVLLDALVACAGVTLKAVATAIGVVVRQGTVKAEGDLD